MKTYLGPDRTIVLGIKKSYYSEYGDKKPSQNRYMQLEI
jgi:hypothetical protein